MTLTDDVLVALLALVVILMVTFFLRLKSKSNTDDELDGQLYVGNLNYNLNEKDLSSHFQAFGDVDEVRIIRDKFNRRSRGYGFVTLASGGAAKSAIRKLNGSTYQGRNIVVRKAHSKQKD